MSVWIKTEKVAEHGKERMVALYMSVWIKTSLTDTLELWNHVALYMSVWIKTFFGFSVSTDKCRTLHECVD